MKRFRLSTLMLLVAIAALVVALVIQQGHSSRRQAAWFKSYEYHMERHQELEFISEKQKHEIMSLKSLLSDAEFDHDFRKGKSERRKRETRAAK